MSAELLLMLAAGAFAGGFINGLAGFGTSLFALGWWLQVMPPAQAVAIALVLSVASGLQGLIEVRASIDRRRLALFLVPALIGIPIGLLALREIDASLLKTLIAGFLLLYGGFFLLRRELPRLTRPPAAIDGGVGFVGGVLGAMAGLSGAIPTMWVAMRDWTKRESRAVLQPYNVAVLGIAAILLAIGGTYDGETLTLIAIALPVTVGASMLGIRLYRRLEDAQFRRLLIAMMFLSGLILLARELL